MSFLGDAGFYILFNSAIYWDDRPPRVTLLDKVTPKSIAQGSRQKQIGANKRNKDYSKRTTRSRLETIVEPVFPSVIGNSTFLCQSSVLMT